MLRTYEAMLIFPSSLKDEVMDKALDRVREEVVRLGGQVLESRRLGKRSFARPMKKRETGQYVLMVLNFDPARIDALHARFRLNDEVFRAQIIKRTDTASAAPAEKPQAAAEPAVAPEAAPEDQPAAAVAEGGGSGVGEPAAPAGPEEDETIAAPA